jgi:hypothetical protein
MRRFLTKRTVIALGVLLALGLASAAAFGPVVRGRLAKEAARRRLEIDVAAVRPGFFAVRLVDVSVRPVGVPELRASLPDVRVELTAGLSVREVVSRGGVVKVDGDLDQVAASLKAWRAAGKGDGEPAAGAGRTELRAEALTVQWDGPARQRLEAKGAAVTRDERGVRFGVETLTLQHGDLSLAVGTTSVDLSPAGTLKSTRAASVELGLDVPLVAASSSATGAASTDPAPPPLPLIAAGKKLRGAKGAQATSPQTAAPADAPLVPLPDLAPLKARLSAVARLVAERLPDGSDVTIDGLSVRVGTGKDRLSLGPGPLSVDHTGNRVNVAFSTERKDAPAPPGTTPLTLKASLPLDQGDVTLSLSGGPVPLSFLGAKDGAAGLADVARATIAGKGQIVLSAAADTLVFDGEVRTRGLSLQNARISTEMLRGIDLAVGARGVLSAGGRLRVDDAQLTLGALHLRAHGALDQAAGNVALSGGFELPAAACQALLESMPVGMFPTLRGARMAGTLGAKGHLVFDSRRPDDLVLDYTIDDRCKMTDVPSDLSRDRFTRAFTHKVYGPDGRPGEMTTGPGTSHWADLDAISPFMQVAVLTTEDGGFPRHRGFNHQAIRNSIVANLKARAFIRGASTITMQLAKNLFLTREKTLSRKLEEIILADYLEQVFRKDDMMELYLNVIEFGPNVYGVVQAAEHYFGRRPDELNLSEALFLSSVLPSPVRYHRMIEKGELPEHWTRHIRTLMEIAQKTGKISQAELADGLAQKLEFVRAGAPRPVPRPPVTGAHFFGGAADDEWQQLN